MDDDDEAEDDAWADGGYAEDEFDYDDFIGREFRGETGGNPGWIFGGGARGRLIQTSIAIILLLLFLAWAFAL